MTRDQFVNLPLKLALSVIWDLARAKLENMSAPTAPLPPKYDGRLGRNGGFIWMSEMDLESLKWWFDTKTKSAKGGGQYAERDGKTAATLDKWIVWRLVFPDARWSGIRDKDRATAAMPSREPQVQQWQQKQQLAPAQTSAVATPPADDGGYGF